jgi:hypothetical protein
MKSQFGPDATIGMLLLLVVSVAGVFFLHMFVNGFSVQSLLSVLDREVSDQCSYVVDNIAYDEFVRSGEKVKDNPTLSKTFSFYGGYSPSMDISQNCEKKIQRFRRMLSYVSSSGEYPQYSSLVTGISGACTPTSKQVDITGERYIVCQGKTYFYNPFGSPGIARVILFGTGMVK